MSDDIKDGLYGKVIQTKLADGKTYNMREPDLDTLIKLELNNKDLTDMKNLRELAYAVLQIDNPDLTEEKISKLITMSMIREGSHFMNSILDILGVKPEEGSEKN